MKLLRDLLIIVVGALIVLWILGITGTSKDGLFVPRKDGTATTPQSE